MLFLGMIYILFEMHDGFEWVSKQKYHNNRNNISYISVVPTL